MKLQEVALEVVVQRLGAQSAHFGQATAHLPAFEPFAFLPVQARLAHLVAFRALLGQVRAFLRAKKLPARVPVA